MLYSANEAFVRANGIGNRAIEPVTTGLATNFPSRCIPGTSVSDAVRYGMTRGLAVNIFTLAGASWHDVRVTDCFTSNEVCN